MKLPIVGEIEIGGQTFKVHAIPFGVAKLATKAGEGDAALASFLSAAWDKCVSTEGEKPPVEDVPFAALNEVVEIATAKADFRKPSPPSASGG